MDNDLPVRLTERNLEVLQHYADGQTAELIAAQLGLNRRTVIAHLIRVRRKLRASSNANAVAIAVALGLIRVHPDERVRRDCRPFLHHGNPGFIIELKCHSNTV